MPTNLWGRAAAIVRRDPRKAGFLTVLLVILVILQVRLQTATDDGPSRASAAVRDGQATITRATASRDGAPRQSSAAALRAWMSAPDMPLTRNLFAVELDRFPQDTSRPQVALVASQGFWDELAKSMSFRADARKERQILLENLQQQASQLRLQSTMMGASPKAVVDGEMVGEGDVVASFRVLKIEPRRIVVEREGIKLEILMK